MLPIRYHKSEYRGNAKELTIHPIGDTHIGHVSLDKEMLKEKIYEIKHTKDTSRVLLMGDLFECATKTSIGAGVFETNMNVDKQIEYAEEIFAPIKDVIDGAVLGNHEERIYSSTSIDVMKQFCRNLEIPYLRYSGVVTYAWNKRAYNINLWHGSGGGSSTASALNKCIGMSNKIHADVYLMGHCHKLANTSRQYRYIDTRNSKIVTTKQYFVLTGSALNYDDNYPDMQNLEIADLGFKKILLGGEVKKKEIKVL